MFRYVGDISKLAHSIIKEYVKEKNIAIDATLGNGYDSDFLSNEFNKVYSFEIQKEPCLKYANKEIENVIVINDTHEKFKDYINDKVDCIIYNLGFLPKGNKEITTMAESSLKSIKVGLDMLKSGGIMSIAIYHGHNEGKIEKTCILEFLKTLDTKTYGVMLHSYVNRLKSAPMLVIIEKR